LLGVRLGPGEDEEAEATPVTRTDSKVANNNTSTNELLAGAIGAACRRHREMHTEIECVVVHLHELLRSNVL